ncbi:MAG: hypothetical protein WA990_01915 [Rubrobacteraceae bacterium]
MESRLVCSVCETIFSEHEARLKLVDPEEDEMQCPNCSSARVEPYALDPEGPVDSPFEDEEPGMA